MEEDPPAEVDGGGGVEIGGVEIDEGNDVLFL